MLQPYREVVLLPVRRLAMSRALSRAAYFQGATGDVLRGLRAHGPGSQQLGDEASFDPIVGPRTRNGCRPPIAARDHPQVYVSSLA
jgi:hypothetical protein